MRLACLRDAVSIGAEYGVWGGVIFWDGTAWLRRRGRGRPKKGPEQKLRDAVPS